MTCKRSQIRVLSSPPSNPVYRAEGSVRMRRCVGFHYFFGLAYFPLQILEKMGAPSERTARPFFLAFSLASLFGIAQRMRSDRRKIMYPSLLALILVWTKAFGENGFMAHRYNPCASRKTYQNYFCGSINAARSCASSEAVKLCLGTA